MGEHERPPPPGRGSDEVDLAGRKKGLVRELGQGGRSASEVPTRLRADLISPRHVPSSQKWSSSRPESLILVITAVPFRVESKRKLESMMRRRRRRKIRRKKNRKMGSRRRSVWRRV